MTVAELSTKVAFWGIKNVDSIELGERDPAGRVQEVIINKTKKMSANEFRVAVGPNLIKSTAFTKVSKMGDSFEFAGKGWGHGVGMCQYGAEAMARAGRSWRKVLVHYYPYAEITKVRLD
jgi:stage II sporulation protein D